MKITDTMRSMISVTPVEMISMYLQIPLIRSVIRSSVLEYIRTLYVNVIASEITRTT